MGLFGGNRKTDEAGESRTYVVKPGDTLSEIAQRMNVDVMSLESANVGVTKGRPSTIYPGQVINIPRGYTHKPVLKDRTVGVPAVHVNKNNNQVHVPSLSVDRGHKDVTIPTPKVETHKKEVTVPTWSLERHDKKIEVPTLSVAKKDVHVDVPTAKVRAHDKEVNVRTYSLGTHEKDVNVKVPGIEAHRKESGYGSTWNPNTPIPETDAEKRLHDERRAAAAGHGHDKKGGFLGLFGNGGEHKEGHNNKGSVHVETDRKNDHSEGRGGERKGGFLGFGGHKNDSNKHGGVLGARDGSGETDFIGIKRYGNRQDIGVEFEEKKGQKVGLGLLLLALGTGAYLAWKHFNKGDRDSASAEVTERKVEYIRKEVKETVSADQIANGAEKAWSG